MRFTCACCRSRFCTIRQTVMKFKAKQKDLSKLGTISVLEIPRHLLCPRTGNRRSNFIRPRSWKTAFLLFKKETAIHCVPPQFTHRAYLNLLCNLRCRKEQSIVSMVHNDWASSNKINVKKVFKNLTV